jgi:hypothetical protein
MSDIFLGGAIISGRMIGTSLGYLSRGVKTGADAAESFFTTIAEEYIPYESIECLSAGVRTGTDKADSFITATAEEYGLLIQDNNRDDRLRMMDKLRAEIISLDHRSTRNTPDREDIIEVELSNVLPPDDPSSSFEVQYEDALVISHDGMSDVLNAEFEARSESNRDESAIEEEVVCV